MAGKGLAKRRRIILAIWVVLVAGIGYGVLSVVWFATGKPTISVDYASQYNEQVRPLQFDPNGDAVPDYREAFAKLPKIPDGIPLIGHVRDHDPSSVEYRILTSWLASCEDAFSLFHKAAAKPYFWGRVSSSDPNAPLSLENLDLNTFLDASHYLCYEAEYLATQDATAEAFRCITTLFRMAGQLDDAGSRCLSVGQIMAMIAYIRAFDLLAHTNVDSALLGEVQCQLEGILAARTEPSFQSDQIVLRDIVQRSFTDDGKDNGHVTFQAIHDYFRQTTKPKSELAADMACIQHLYIAWHHPSRRETIQTADRLMEAATQLIRQTPWELHAQGLDCADRLAEPLGGNAFLRPIAERPLTWEINNHYRIIASMEALIATIGILRFHQDKGTWPASLEELAAAGHIRRIPTDPYGDGPLVYRRTDSSFILYSRWYDLDDDGGVSDKRGPGQDGDEVFWPRKENKK